MSGMSNYTATGLLTHVVGETPIFPMPTAYVALFSAVGFDDGTGFTELSGGGYARVRTSPSDWATPSGSAPSAISNINPLIYPVSTSGWGSIIGFGVYDAATAGNLLVWDYFGNYGWMPASVIAASPAVITAPRHNLALGDTVIWSNEYGGMPPNFSQGSFNGILTVAQPLTDTFQVTIGGNIVNTTLSGNGTVRKFVSQNIVANVQATFPPGSLVITAA